jgi:hypothetical protein
LLFLWPASKGRNQQKRGTKYCIFWWQDEEYLCNSFTNESLVFFSSSCFHFAGADLPKSSAVYSLGTAFGDLGSHRLYIYSTALCL